MIKYRRFQFGWIIIIVFVMVIVWMAFAYRYQWGNNPVDIYGFVFFLVLFGGILLNFYGLTVIVSDSHIIIRFGIGIFSKKINLSNVRSVRLQKYPVYYGYGIRIIPGGILYNVNGSYAVEVRFKNKSSVVQIGTDDWENLRDAIETSMASLGVHKSASNPSIPLNQ